MTHTKPATHAHNNDVKRLLSVMNLVVNEMMEDDSDGQHMLFALIDAIGDKLAAAEKMIDASRSSTGSISATRATISRSHV